MPTPDSAFLYLSLAEINSPLWVKLKAHYENRLRELRGQNDGPMEEGARNIKIGQISEVKRLLEAGTPQN